MPIAVPRSEVGANIDTKAGRMVSNAVKPKKKLSKVHGDDFYNLKIAWVVPTTQSKAWMKPKT